MRIERIRELGLALRVALSWLKAKPGDHYVELLMGSHCVDLKTQDGVTAVLEADRVMEMSESPSVTVSKPATHLKLVKPDEPPEEGPPRPSE